MIQKSNTDKPLRSYILVSQHDDQSFSFCATERAVHYYVRAFFETLGPLDFSMLSLQSAIAILVPQIQMSELPTIR